MTVTYAEKLSRMPGYQAGVPTGQAPEAIAYAMQHPAEVMKAVVRI